MLLVQDITKKERGGGAAHDDSGDEEDAPPPHHVRMYVCMYRRSGNFRVRNVCAFNFCRVAKWRKLNFKLNIFACLIFAA